MNVSESAGYLFAGATGIAQTIGGIVQTKRANKKLRELEENKQPYQIPSGIQAMLEIYKQRAGGEMPGLSAARENIASSGAGAVGQISEQAGGGISSLGAIADIYSQQLNAYRQLDAQSAQYQDQSMRELGSAYGAMAPYQNLAYDYNVQKPYEQAVAMYLGQKTAGQQNMMTGLQNVAGAAAGYLGTNSKVQSVEQMYGSNAGMSKDALGNSMPSTFGMPTGTPQTTFNVPTGAPGRSWNPATGQWEER